MATSSVIERIDRIFEGSAGDGPGAKAGAGATEAEVEEAASPQTAVAPKAGVDSHAQQLVDLERFIDGEIRDRIGAPNMTWRKLEACFKWRALQDYMAARGVASDSATFSRVRDLLRAQQLTAVEYDARSHAIRRINHANDDTCIALDGIAVAATAAAAR